jgi:hypothetical protein
VFLDQLDVRLLDDRAEKPWLTISPRRYEDPETGEIHTIPKGFLTDGASLPAALVAVPLLGPLLFLRYFGKGVFQGFAEGVLHDYLLTVLPAHEANRIFRTALIEAGYPEDLIETYYAAVVDYSKLKD